jgi:hypothetical protein
MGAALAASVVMAVVVLASPAWAATFTVKNNTDSGPGSLRQAIIRANTTSGVADTINFDLGSSATITLTSAQLPTITDGAGLTIDGGSADITISGANQYRVFEVGSDAMLTVSNLTVANGADATAGDGGGGGIYNGGGTLEVSNSTLSSNSVPNGVGGGIFNASGTLEVSNSTLSSNSANIGGGGIFNRGTVTMSNSTLSGNSANDFGGGGGIYNHGGTLTVSNSTLSGNSIPNGVGGGIFNASGTLEVSNSNFSGNSAPNGFGGGIASDVSDRGTLEVSNSTLSSNSAGGGGGIYNSGGRFNTLTVSSSTLSGNSANDFGGGGILISQGTATVSNSTLWGNSATVSGFDGGGGIYNRGGGTVTLKNTIVANSPSASGGNCHGTTITNGGYNLDSDNTCGFGTDNNSLSGIDPMLGDLADNGGPTMTHALLEGSPAIDKGNSFGESTDQRGEERPSDFDTVANATDGDGSDIGAFEVQASAPPPDETAPYVESTSPDNGQNEVSRTTTVTANFSEEVKQDTLTTANVQLFAGNSTKPVKATLSPTSTSVTLTPSSKLDANTTYRAVVGTGVKDLADNPLDQDQDPDNGNQPKEWTFTTGPK